MQRINQTILTILIFSAMNFAYAEVPNPLSSRILGANRLLALVPGQSTAVTISTPEGTTKIQLKRKVRRTPVGKIIAKNSVLKKTTADHISLFQGRVLAKSNRQSKNNVASASIYKNKLRVYFQGNRKRAFTAIFDLRTGALPEKKQTGRISHYPSVLQVHCGEPGISYPDFKSRKDTSLPAGEMLLEVGMDADYEFYQDNGSSSSATLAELENIINNVSAIYSAQLGIEFTLSDYNIYTDSSQPYTSTNTSSLLTQMGDYLNDNTSHLTGDVRHLMTGKNTSYQGNSSIVGLAYLGVVCSSTTANIGLSEKVTDSIQHLVVAHEIGHNFGANHDSDSPPTIMYPSVAPDRDTFSNFSLNEINDHLSGNTECLEDGNGGGGGGGDSSDVTLKVKLNDKNKFKFVIEPNGFSTTGCTINVDAASSSSKLDSEPTRVLSVSGTGGDLTVKNSVKKTPKKKVYFRASVVCDQTYQSSVKTLKANSGSDLKAVSVSKFLEYLERRL